MIIFPNQYQDIALIKSNAKRAAEIAVALSQLGGTSTDMVGENDVKERPVSS